MKLAYFKKKQYAVTKNNFVPLPKSVAINKLLDEEYVKDLEALVKNSRDLYEKIPEALDPPLKVSKLLGIGINYQSHAKEQGEKPPEAPIIFQKASTAVIGHGHPVIAPKIVTMLDYEVELAVIIGKRGKYIEKDEVNDYIAGFTIFNDISARDHQFKYNNQWFIGKSFDTFAPVGPWIVDKFEIGDPQNLNMETKLNGKIMQSSNTKNMIFKIPDIIHFISNVLTLEPGDVIFTGTPEGVGFTRKPPVYLKAGDVLDLSIEKIGTLHNMISQ
jgi:2-keto-4-pentenoate hydratase/2-oxohepta-3-ene-1,7-dioic acid hydratase in catechol pathway